MTFKLNLKLLCAVVTSVALSSCSDFTKGKPKKETVLEVKQESMSCLKTVSLDIKKFLKSESTNEEIDKTFSCIDNTLKEFQTRVEGKAEADAFTADELYQIFDKFIKDAAISKAATEDLMTLKAALLGGSNTKITKTEISVLRSYIETLKAEAKALLPYSQLFTFKKTEVVFSKSMIRNGFAQLSLSLKNMLKASKIGSSNYQFADFKKLVINLKLVDEKQDDMLILFKQVSDMLTGGENLTNEDDKALYVDNITEVLRLYTLYIQGHVKMDINNKENMDSTFEYVQSAVELMENSVQFKRTKAVSFDDIEQLIKDFIKKVPADTPEKKSAEMYQKIVMDIFESGFVGANSKMTKTELTSLKSYLQTLKADIAAISSYKELFQFKKSEVQISKEVINAGILSLTRALKNFVNTSNYAKDNYDLNNLIGVLKNLELNEQQKSIMLLLERVNNLLIGGQQLISKEDKDRYIDNITEVLRLYAIHTQGYVKYEISSSENVKESLEYTQAMITLLENSVQYKKTKIVSSETIDPLLVEVLKKNILPLKVTAETALSFYKTIAVRVFEAGLAGDVTGFSGLKKVHFANLNRELAIYRIYNQFIESVAGTELLNDKKMSRLPLKDVQAHLKAYEQKQYQEILNNFDKDTQAQIVSSVEELKTEFLDKTPVLYRFNKIILSANQEIWDQNWSDLARGLYYSMISRQLLLGWGQTPLVKEVKNASVAEQGLVQWYSEFKKFGIETKIFDPRSKNSGASNLSAANLFTRSGNGDNKMNFRESIQFLGILFSGGGKVYEEMASSFKKANCNLPEKDVFGHNWNNEACAYEDFKQNYKYYFSNLSYLVGYLDKLKQDEKEFKDFYESVMSVARLDSTAKGRLETGDMRAFSILLHYVESIYAAYDEDRNWKLSEKEIKNAYPRFKGFAEQFARKSAADSLAMFNSWKGKVGGYGCFTEQDLIKESFVFMVYYGKTPASSDLTNFPCLRNEPLIKFEGEVERKSIINTFKIIKSVLG
ncbi:hypothetical protein K2P97_11270 [bacterium]|nr:hypothetical protein [bacterium]